MRVLLDGEFFATGDNLDVIAEIGDIDVSRLSFDPEDMRRLKVEEMAECALSEIRGLFRTSLPSYEVLGIHNARLLHGNDEEYPPRYLAVMEMIQDRNEKLEAKLYEVAVADDPASVEWSQ